MDTSIIESLLERLIDKQDELILRIESLETIVEIQLREVNMGISSLEHSSSLIRSELDWVEDLSLGKAILTALTEIESAVANS